MCTGFGVYLMLGICMNRVCSVIYVCFALCLFCICTAVYAEAVNPATLQVNPELKAELNALARQTHRDETELANEALENYIAWEKQALNKIREGLAQADRGEFATDEEMDAFFEQHSLPFGK